MKTLLTPTQLIAYRVPEDSKDFSLVDMFNLPSVYYVDSMGFGNTLSLGFDNPDIILGCVDKGVIDFDCESCVEEFITFSGKPLYKNYRHKDGLTPYYEKPVSSFLSLLESHSLSLDKKYLIIKPKQ